MARSDVDVALGAPAPDDTRFLPAQRYPGSAECDERLLAGVRRGLLPDDPVARLIARFRQEAVS